jgi:hypothetical protein
VGTGPQIRLIESLGKINKGRKEIGAAADKKQFMDSVYPTPPPHPTPPPQPERYEEKKTRDLPHIGSMKAE